MNCLQARLIFIANYCVFLGEFLFYHKDWLHFYVQVTNPYEVLLPPDKLQALVNFFNLFALFLFKHNNLYVIDFLKYVLVREPAYRPTIDNILSRFEHIHALLVSNNPYSSRNLLQTPISLSL